MNKMRKFSAGLAALMMTGALMIPAMAADITPEAQTRQSMEVSVNLDETYTISIPADVTLDKAGTYQEELALTASGVRLSATNKLGVKVGSANQFKLMNGSNEIAYSLKLSDAPVADQQEVLTVNSGSATGSASMTVSAEETAVDAVKVSGEYSDTLTFTAAIEAAAP